MYHTNVKTISVTELKARCHELVDEVSQTGESIVVTHNGKPAAMLVQVPAEQEKSKKWNPGQNRHTGTIIGDICSPSSDW